MKLITLLLGVFTFGLVLGIGIQKAPRLLSWQDPVDPTQLTGAFDSQAEWGVFLNQLVPIPHYLADLPTRYSTVLGANTTNKRIEVDLTKQRLYAFEGNAKVMDFAISSGKWGKTPTGTFKIWAKLRYTRMTGGSVALHTYYNLPNVPYTMYFYNDEIPKSRGYGIHGAYWHNNFGHPMSHGCINVKPEEAGQLFNWAEPPLAPGKNMVTVTDDDASPTIVIYGAVSE